MFACEHACIDACMCIRAFEHALVHACMHVSVHTDAWLADMAGCTGCQCQRASDLRNTGHLQIQIVMNETFKPSS